jgi:hypothetical protein
MAEKQPFEQDLAEIRSLMEKSSKFISLSGLSGILAGVYALAGSTVVYFLLPSRAANYEVVSDQDSTLVFQIAAIALIVFVASIITGFMMSARKAKRHGIELWTSTSKRLVINLAIPLLTGGAFILLLVMQSRYGLVAPVCLIFYGLALMNASTNLYEEVRYLGYSEIVLGLIATALPEFGLFFWATGFGLFHLFYGSLMFRKYDG